MSRPNDNRQRQIKFLLDVEYYWPVKTKAKTTDEYAIFSSALRKVLRVSHSEMQARIEADKQARKRRRQKRTSARASSAKD